MSMERMATAIEGECPVCAAFIRPQAGVEETEILSCPVCQSQLVVESRNGGRLRLGEAPAIEEDWGE
jgi:lysine biosynthesis protein LysW